jgi:hypothetical protein
MALGVGTIRLQGTAAIPAAGSGQHQIYYRNTHQSGIGVYLLNTMAPADKQMVIAQQRRDYLQREITVDYRVEDLGRTSLGWLLVGLAMVCALAVTRRSNASAKSNTL